MTEAKGREGESSAHNGAAIVCLCIGVLYLYIGTCFLQDSLHSLNFTSDKLGMREE